jgi:dolichol-phosphate mannosyltransferase
MTAAPELSVVVPVMNEVENAVPLLNEICAALRGKVSFEAIFVDDASRDATVQSLKAAQAQTPELRVLKHAKNSGQSRAVRTGVLAARGTLIATLDGDGQNDPADIPNLLATWRTAVAGDPPLGLVAGQRRKTIL